jgi:hypothetical protein
VAKRILVAALWVLLDAAGAQAQASKGRGLAYLIPDLFGGAGLIVSSDTPLPSGEAHSAHFNSAFQRNFGPFNTALATQIAAVPLPTPASGFTYGFDANLGVFQRSTQSFGPILSGRAETIGKKKFSLSVNYQSFRFDSIDGVDLGNLPAVFTHDNATAGTGTSDLVTTVNSIDLSVDQVAAFLTYGVADRLDVSVAIPVVRTQLDVSSIATVQRIGTVNPLTHYFKDARGGVSSIGRFASSGNASGVGDIIVQVKGTAFKQGATGLALALDARLPTGSEENLLGSGAVGLKPFAALSFSHKRFSPHLNLAYQWNGKSILAGFKQTGAGIVAEKADLPDQVLYAVGADLGLSQTLTLAFDILGRRVINSQQLVPETFQALDGRSTFPNIAFQASSFNELDAAVGFKVNVAGRLLVDFNLLFKLNDSGLRDKATPLLGIEYSF